MTTIDPKERLERWRLLLGGQDADGTSARLDSRWSEMDRVLAALYEPKQEGASRRGGLGPSAPSAARWLGDIRTYFPISVVRVMQRDAIDRLGITSMLLEPETLDTIVPDVQLVSELMTLSGVIPKKAKATARLIVQAVVEDLKRKLEAPLKQTVSGALRRSSKNRRPRPREIDWNRTIRANLKHYQEEYKTIVPENRVGYGRHKQMLRSIIICLDQSGSMGESVVYSGVCGAVLASLPALKTHVVAFDTEVVDLSEKMTDPVDVLLGVQLGGGTDINRAVAYCQTLMIRPTDTIFVLVTDLHEGGNADELMERVEAIVASGVKMVCLLALSDRGAPDFNEGHAATLASMGVPSFACTPDKFADLLAAAINGQDLGQWAGEEGMTTTRKVIGDA